jgi:hypothetical protein
MRVGVQVPLRAQAEQRRNPVRTAENNARPLSQNVWERGLVWSQESTHDLPVVSVSYICVAFGVSTVVFCPLLGIGASRRIELPIGVLNAMETGGDDAIHGERGHTSWTDGTACVQKSL